MISSKDTKLKRKLLKMFGQTHRLVRVKIENLQDKTSQYSVPDELFQNRTALYSRVLIPWKSIERNNITIEHLNTFYGGVCVEFVNYDYIDPKNQNNKTFTYVKNKLGSNDMISSIISFRTEDGDSGAAIPRASYKKFKILKNQGKIDIKLSPIKRDSNEENRISETKGEWISRGDNGIWNGNYYCSIKGGEQESITSHNLNENEALFNPAIDYANHKVVFDIQMTMMFFMLHCYDLENCNSLKKETKDYLKSRDYDKGNLYEYCRNHDSLKYGDGFLIDPIQFKKMSIHFFHIDSSDENCANSCHNEAANKDNFSFDERNGYILSAQRPMNLFWSTKLSNMMQQNFTLDEYWEKQKKWIEIRKKIVLK
jgi:hypothetical protein|tara:strand:+ start:600 stop:1706 length:1107 start_codon:yes stop_codon:yes gene_type:complete